MITESFTSSKNGLRQCDAECIGRTNQMLEAMIDKYVPAKIHRGQCENLHILVNTSSHGMAPLLINNPICSFEAIYIKSKQPSLRTESECSLLEFTLPVPW